MKKKKIIIIILLSIIIITLLLVFLRPVILKQIDTDTTNNKNLGVIKNSLGNEFIAYVPLDDRPVNTDRVSYLSSSIGYKLLMPDSSLFGTKLNSNKIDGDERTYGDIYNLAKWLLKMENDGCDYYIISLDQLFSGGLVSSRYLNDSDIDSDSINFAKHILESLISDSNNHIYLFDSVMRLAPTVDYLDFNLDDYHSFYDYSSIARVKLNDSDLSIDNIFNNYQNDNNGNYINNNLDNVKLTRYLNARRRKLELSSYYLNLIKGKNNVSFMIGIDDSSNKENIQYNEINYLKKLINNNTIIRDGIDELGMLSFTKLVLNTANTNININTLFYGDKKDEKASTYSSQTISENYSDLLKNLNVSNVNENEDIDVLLFTGCNNSDEVLDNSLKLINKYIDNINNHIPTIIIDASRGNDGKIFRESLIKYAPLGFMIGYSNWQDFSNLSGIALSEGITRYLYLRGNNQNDNSDIAFLKLLTFSFTKDIAYKTFVSPNLSDVVSDLDKYMSPYTLEIIKNLENSNYISNIIKYEEKGIGTINIFNYSYPWNRLFEIRFDMDIKTDSKKELKLQKIEIEKNTKDDNLEIEENKNTDNEVKTEDNNINTKDDTSTNKTDNNTNNNSNTNNDSNTNNNSKKETVNTTNKVIHYAIINDDLSNNKYFYPDNYITRKDIAKWICKANNISVSKKYNGYYNDVTTSTINWSYIETATKHGYFKGNNNGKFNPDGYLTRAEMASLIVQIANADNINLTNSKNINFSDVTSDSWYYSNVMKVARAGIINGYGDGTFRPNNNITKAEAVTILIKFLHRDSDPTYCNVSKNANPFKDVSSSHWAYYYLIEAYYKHSC